MPITFESVRDLVGTGVNVTNQFAADGVLFTNALAVTAGLSLNEIAFPPFSGDTAVQDVGGPMVLDFTVPFFSVSARFTYSQPLTLKAFSATSVLLAQVSSSFSSNLAGGSGAPGSLPNELLTVSSATPIAKLVITGDPAGFSFAMDDLNAAGPSSTTVPEPTAVVLLLTGLATGRVIRRVQK